MIQDSWAIARSLYGVLLLLALPNLLLAIAVAAPLPLGVQVSLSLVDILIVTPLFLGAAIACVHRRLQEQSQDLLHHFGQALSAWPHLTGGWLMLHLFLAPGMIGLAFARVYYQWNLPFVALILVAIALGLCLPGLYVTIRFLFVLHGIMVARLSLWSALRTSWQRVRGRWWGVFRAILVLNLLLLPVVWGIAAIATYGLQQVTVRPLATLTPVYWRWLRIVIRDCLSYGLTPLIGVYTFLLYWRLSLATAAVSDPIATSPRSRPEPPPDPS